jgi:L-alanine-DL-glutamate epimerase-like enolase superfamily enzyme
VKITAIRLDRMRVPLDPPFHAAWDPVPRCHFDATLVRVETDEGITGYGSGDTMDGFEAFAPLFTGRDPLTIADHVRTISSIGFHAGRYWPLEAALWDILGKVTGQPVSALFGGATRRLPAYASFGEARSSPGPTASACWPTCTWWPTSAAAPTSNSPTIPPAGPSSAATSSSPTPSASTPKAT